MAQQPSEIEIIIALNDEYYPIAAFSSMENYQAWAKAVGKENSDEYETLHVDMSMRIVGKQQVWNAPSYKGKVWNATWQRTLHDGEPEPMPCISTTGWGTMALNITATNQDDAIAKAQQLLDASKETE